MTQLMDVTWQEVNDHTHSVGSIVSNISSDIEVLDDDKLSTIYVATGQTNKTVTLSSTEDNRVITVKKIDNGAGDVVFIGNIDGDTNKRIGSINTSVTIQYDLTNTVWRII